MPTREGLAVGLLQLHNATLLVKEAYGARLWTLPGGFVEAGESFSEAVVREVREETGLETKVQGIIAVRERATQLIIVFALDCIGGTLLESVPGEIEAIEWFDWARFEQAQQELDDFAHSIVQRALRDNLLILKSESWKGRHGAEANLYIN